MKRMTGKLQRNPLPGEATTHRICPSKALGLLVISG